MAIFRVMAIHQGASDDPKDRYVNNFHFSGVIPAGVSEDLVANVTGALDDFYGVLHPFMRSSITLEDYRFYNLDDAKPRPVTFSAAGSQPSGTGTPYPYEVAAALSFYSVRNLPRRRGRLFLGPLTSSVSATGDINDDPQVSVAFRQLMTAAADALATDVASAGGDGAVAWSIYSPTDGQARPVTHAWMDNAFDTIRARGSASTARTTVVF